MDTLEFLQAVWPEEGWYCLVIFHDDHVRQFWYDSIEGAANAAKKFDASGVSVYHACASFKEKGSRKASNVLAVAAAWMDLDVGAESNKFSTVTDAATALKEFTVVHALPTPSIISSGSGLHAYWTYTQSVDAVVGKALANDFKRLAIANAFRIDPSRTADLASILRPVGTRNFKYDPPRQVQVVHAASPVDFAEFAAAIRKDLPEKPKTTRKSSSVNSDFLWTTDFPPSDANVIADKCNQIRLMRETKGNISEPHWYSAIQLLHFSQQSDPIIHEWSSGHPEYIPEQTDVKIMQVNGYGPTSCVTFEQRNPIGCNGCIYRGKITSPIQLGVLLNTIEPPKEALITEKHDAFVDAPAPFKRTEYGVVFTNDDGIDVPVYPYDLFVSEIAYDAALGYAVATITHNLPQDGWQEFSMRASAVGNQRDFEQVMRDKHVMPRNTKLLQSYVGSYMQTVQHERKTRTLFNNMGWNGDCIVLGDTAYYEDGREELAGLSESLRQLAPAFVPKGELEPWVEATRVFDNESMEAHAFMFCAGPGALLMKFSGFEATMFNALGPTNSGKTMMGRFMMSMYGDYDALKLKKDDTDNAKIGRISLLGSLPVYIEEVTNEDFGKVSDFCYEVTQGRSKLRLRIDGTEREVRKWNTIVVSSANTSLSAKLGLGKSNPDAERLRLFEFPVERTSMFERGVADRLFWTLSNNYGHAGIEFARYVVGHRSIVQKAIVETIGKINIACSALPEERMWVASVACCICGAQLMKSLGLVRFDVKRVAKWAVAQLIVARSDMAEGHVSPIELLGLYMNEFSGNRLVVRESGVGVGGMQYHADLLPRGSLIIRYDATPGVNRAWVEQQHFRHWCVEHHEDFRKVKNALTSAGVLLGIPRRTLGKGTDYAAGTVLALELDMAHPAMGNIVARSVNAEPPKAERLYRPNN